MASRGGKREGAGRPPKPEGRLKPYTVSLTQEQHDWLKEAGGAKKVRELIDREMGGNRAAETLTEKLS